MYENSPVELRMGKTISADTVFDDTIHRCKVFRYDIEQDYIHLELKENDLREISLDAKYQCYIYTKSENLYCSGVVKERFRSENGNMILFKIENGFYNVDERSGIH